VRPDRRGVVSTWAWSTSVGAFLAEYFRGAEFDHVVSVPSHIVNAGAAGWSRSSRPLPTSTHSLARALIYPIAFRDRAAAHAVFDAGDA